MEILHQHPHLLPNHLLDYQHLLPDDLWHHTLSFLHPYPFLQFSATCKQFNTHHFHHKYFVAWFQGHGCASYLSPQVTKTLSSISREKYYSVVHSLIREFKIVSLLPNELEPTTPSHAAMRLCTSNECLLVYYQNSGTAIEFSARPPFHVLKRWILEVESVNISAFAEFNGKYFLMLYIGENNIIVTYQLLSDGSVKHSYTCAKSALYYSFHQGHEILVQRSYRKESMISVHHNNTLIWEKAFTSEYPHPLVVHIASGTILLLDDQELHLYSVESGRIIAKLTAAENSTLGSHMVGDIKVVEYGSVREYHVVMTANFMLHYWIVRTGGTSGFTGNCINLKSDRQSSPTLVLVSIQSNRVVVVHADGAIDVLALPLTNDSQVHSTVVGFSATNIISAAVTEDSRVFLTLSTGIVVALDFTKTDFWNVLPDSLSSAMNSQLVSKIITTMLHKIGDLTTLLVAANTNLDMESFITQYTILQLWFREIGESFPGIARLQTSPFINRAMANFGRLHYLWATANELKKKDSEDLQHVGNYLDDLLQALNTEFDTTTYPHFPLRKTLEYMASRQNLMAQYKKVIVWVTLAKKVPKSITWAKITSEKRLVMAELTAAPELHKLAMSEVEEIETLFLGNLSLRIVQAVCDSESAMTASGTFQSKILESLCLLISFEEFHLIRPSVLKDLIDFLVHFQTMGDLNFVNQTLCEKCTKVLHSQTTKGFSDSPPIPPAGYPSESCSEQGGMQVDTNYCDSSFVNLEILVNNFLYSLLYAKENSGQTEMDVTSGNNSEDYSADEEEEGDEEDGEEED